MKSYKVGLTFKKDGGVAKITSVNSDGTATAHWIKPPNGSRKGELLGKLPSLTRQRKTKSGFKNVRGSDVSGFEKTFREAITTGSVEALQELYNTPDKNRPKIFRGKNPDFINTTVNNLRREISEISDVKTPILSTSNDNKDGSDFVEQISGTEYEIKLGGATDANLGIGIMEWALDNHGIIRNIMGTMNDRKEMYLKGVAHSEILENKEKSKEAMVEAFNKKVTVGETASERLTHLAKLIAKGVTREESIVEAFNSGDEPNKPHLLLLQKDGTFKHHDKSFPEDEEFIVIKAAVGSKGGGAQIVLQGRKSGRTIEFRQHFKNSHTDNSTGVKIPAKFWVKTPCFNVWIG